MPSLMRKELSSHIFKHYIVEYVTSRKPGLEMENIIPTHILLASTLSRSPPTPARKAGNLSSASWEFLQIQKGLLEEMAGYDYAGYPSHRTYWARGREMPFSKMTVLQFPAFCYLPLPSCDCPLSLSSLQSAHAQLFNT